MFGRKKEPTVGDYVEAVRGQAGAAARTYGPIARDRAQEAYAWSRPRLDPYVQEARRRAQPYVDRAIETAAPKMQRAVDTLEPRVDKTRDVLVQSWIPRLSAGVAALAGATACLLHIGAEPRAGPRVCLLCPLASDRPVDLRQVGPPLAAFA